MSQKNYNKIQMYVTDRFQCENQQYGSSLALIKW